MENRRKGREEEASLLTFVLREVLQPMEGGSDAFSKRLVSIKAKITLIVVTIILFQASGCY